MVVRPDVKRYSPQSGLTKVRGYGFRVSGGQVVSVVSARVWSGSHIRRIAG